MQLDKSSPKPVYKQLVDQILSDIREGVLKPNDKLPTERELEEKFAISRTTVKKAYKELHDNGVIEVIQGSGSYVHDNGQGFNSSRYDVAMDSIDRLLEKLLQWDFSLQEITYLMRSCISKKENQGDRLRVALVDCNIECLSIFKRQLLHIPHINISVFLVESILLDDAPGQLLMDFDLILTTLTHYGQIVEHIGDAASRLTRVAVTPSLNTVSSLSRLKASDRIGIVCRTSMFADIIKDNLEQIMGQRATHLTVYFEYVLKNSEPTPLEQLDAIIIDPNSLLLNSGEQGEAVHKYRDNGGSIIPFDYIIDNGSLAHIEDQVRMLLKNKEAETA